MHLIEWARRHAEATNAESAIEDLKRGLSTEEVARRHGMPRSAVVGVQSFYEFLREGEPPRCCSGTACSFPDGASSVHLAAEDGRRRVHCVGRCYEAPARFDTAASQIPRRALVDAPIVLRHLLGGNVPSLAERYALPESEEILTKLESSGLRGRGGAAYPTGKKWRAARQATGDLKFVVANGDEGDPGAFIDRLLLEDDPHAVLAGMNACAHATGASRGIVYVRAEYPRAADIVRRAIAEAEAARVLIAGFRLEVHVGAGAYVAGEETALLRAIEGLRAEPSPKPPYPAERGLFGMPTVVQNIETLSVVPWVLHTGRRPDTKAFCLSGAVEKKGVVEARLGVRLRTLLEEGGEGARAGHEVKMALIGGPMGRLVPLADFDVELGYDTLPGMGHGGIVVFDTSVSARALAEHLFDFARSESCGNCAPCRIGTAELSHIDERGALERLLETLEIGSLCGFGQGVSQPIRDLIEHYPLEMFPSRGVLCSKSTGG